MLNVTNILEVGVAMCITVRNPHAMQSNSCLSIGARNGNAAVRYYK